MVKTILQVGPLQRGQANAATLAIGVRLVNEIGFDAVPVGGGLRGSAKFELRGPANGLHTAAQLKTIMGN